MVIVAVVVVRRVCGGRWEGVEGGGERWRVRFLVGKVGGLGGCGGVCFGVGARALGPASVCVCVRACTCVCMPLHMCVYV